MRRDPFGQRPLYYTGDGRTATSVWALESPALDPQAVRAALIGALPPHRSLFQGIHRVPPGHELRPGPSVTRWWEPPARVPEMAPEVAVAELRHRLRSALGRLAAGSRVACSLSGGLDSSGIVALLAEEGRAVTAWSLADDFESDGEMSRAREVAARFRAEHRVVEVSEEELPDHVPEAVRACEDLLWNGGAVARHRFFRAVREEVLLSGVGADEVLGGGPGLWPRAEERELALSLLEPGLTGFFEHSQGWDRSFDALSESALPPECRAAAAAGIDVRLPYLELEVAEFGLTLPASLRQDKALLREALRGRVPDAVVAAPKRPRLAPAGGRTARARARWLAFYAQWLAPQPLRDLGVAAGGVAALLDTYRQLPAADPRLGIQDAVLMKIASAVILHGTLAGRKPSSKDVGQEV